MALLPVQHFTHPHPIILHNDAINPKYLCEGCMTYGYGQRYHCHACTFNLHEYCGTCPEILSSFMHPDHQLAAIECDGLPERVCNICYDPIDGLSYRCELCEFNVHPICTQLPETLNHILHQAHPLMLIPGSAELVGICGVCSGVCDVFSWRYRCSQCKFDIHIDCVPIQCDKRTVTDRGIPAYVPPSVLFAPQPYLGGFDYGIPHSHPLNMNHNYMPQSQPQPQPHPQPQHQIHEIPHWHPSTSAYFPSPLNMNHNNMPQPQPQHQNYGTPYWHPSTSTSPCIPGQLNLNHNNIPQPKPQTQPQLQHQNHGIPYRYPNPNPFPSPSNMHHYNYNMPQYPQLYEQQHQGDGQAQTHNGGSGRRIGRVMFKLVKTIGLGVISHVVFGVNVIPFLAS